MPPDGGAPEPGRSTISSDGGTVILEDNNGRVMLEVPPGAVNSPADFKIVAESPPNNQPLGLTLVSDVVYDVTISSGVFNGELSITLPVPGGIQDGVTYSIMWLNEGNNTWLSIPSSVDETSDTIIGRLDHLSVFGVFLEDAVQTHVSMGFQSSVGFRTAEEETVSDAAEFIAKEVIDIAVDAFIRFGLNITSKALSLVSLLDTLIGHTVGLDPKLEVVATTEPSLIFSQEEQHLRVCPSDPILVALVYDPGDALLHWHGLSVILQKATGGSVLPNYTSVDSFEVITSSEGQDLNSAGIDPPNVFILRDPILLPGPGNYRLLSDWESDSASPHGATYVFASDDLCEAGGSSCGDGTITTMSATLPLPTYSFVCAESSTAGKIYCFGGGPGGATFYDEILEYDANADSLVTKTAVLPRGRFGLACATHPATGKIYCFGGDAGPYLTQIVEYNPNTDMLVTKSAVLPSPRVAMGCATDAVTGKIYCFGGNGTSVYYDQILEYNPMTDTLATKSATLPSRRGGPACAASTATGRIYCFGGRDESVHFDQIVEYTPATDTLVTKNAVLPSGRNYFSCAADAATGKIYCFGGFNGSTRFNEILEYDPNTDTLVTKSTTLPSRRNLLACAPDSSTGRIFCFGGNDESGVPLDEIVEYDPPGCGLFE